MLTLVRQADPARAPKRSSPATRWARSLLRTPLVRALTYPHSVDHYFELTSPRGSLGTQAIRAKVVQVVHETHDVVTLVLRPGRRFPPYRAGQYVALTVEIDGVRHTRCFSLSSSPLRSDGLLTVTIKAHYPHGFVSAYLVENALPGLELTLSAPTGEFVLPEELPKRIFFISGGSGITPCMSMLRSLVDAGLQTDVTFLHYARSELDVIFHDELEQLAQREPRLTLRIETDEERGGPKPLDAAELARHLPDFAHAEAWACGPAGMLDAVRAVYGEHDALERLHTEAFTLAPAQGEVEATGTVALARSDLRITGDSRPLLNQVEQAGVDGKRGCGMGVCMSCRCKKLSGTTRNLRTGALSTDNDDHIQLCIHAPVGDVTLDL